MEIRSLASTPFEEIISCFLSAFEGYFVKLPADVNYWKERFVTSRVNWDLSFGMFDEQKLLGYIINCIDVHNKILTAYNTGTGVLAEYRGRAIVDQLYESAIPLLKEHGIERCLLEVICENERAIKVYERIGFNITRKLCSYSGTLTEGTSEDPFQKCNFQQVIESGLTYPQHYSWDNSAGAIDVLDDRIHTMCLGTPGSPEAYLVMDLSGNIIQLESRSKDYSRLLDLAGRFSKEVKLKNVDSKRETLLNTLQKRHFSNTVNQYEMEMFI